MSDHTQSTSSNRRKLLLRLSWASSHLTPIWTGPRRAGKLKALTALLSSLTLLSSPLPLLTHSKVHRPGPSRPSPVRRLRFGALGHCWLRGRQLGTGTCTTHSFLFGTPEGHASRAQARIHHLCHHSPANSELWPQSRRRAHLAQFQTFLAGLTLKKYFLSRRRKITMLPEAEASGPPFTSSRPLPVRSRQRGLRNP